MTDLAPLPNHKSEIHESRGHYELINEYANVRVLINTGPYLSKKEALKILEDIKEKVDKRVVKQITGERVKLRNKIDKTKSKIEELRKQYDECSDEDEKELIGYQIEALVQFLEEIYRKIEMGITD